MTAVPTEERLDRAAVAGFLDHVVPGGLAGELLADQISGGRSNPTYELTDGQRRWILRRPPFEPVLQSAHDVLREHRIIVAMEPTGVPVPHAVAACADPAVIGAPFYVMDRIDGRTLRTAADTATLPPEQRTALAEAMVDTLVRLHEVEPAEVGLDDLGRPHGYLERQVRRWGRQWDAVHTRAHHGVDRLLAHLLATLPDSGRPGIVHGDFKIDNLMVGHDDPTRVLAVLDWEMATVGDPLADLGLLISFWDEPGQPFNPITNGATALPGFPSGVEVIERYVHRRGLSVDDLDWYLVFADLKVAVILEQIHARRGEASDVGTMVVPLLDRAVERAGL